MYICKIASFEEVNRKWDYEIEHNINDRKNWTVWKKDYLENFRKGFVIPYYGILDKDIICEATTAVNPEAVQNSGGLVSENTVYLFAFRTVGEYRGKGYFSRLMKFMLDDLKQKGFERATLGIEPSEEINRKIYAHFGFTEYIKSASESYPDKTVIDVDYYGRSLQD